MDRARLRSLADHFEKRAFNCWGTMADEREANAWKEAARLLRNEVGGDAQTLTQATYDLHGNFVDVVRDSFPYRIARWLKGRFNRTKRVL